MKTISFKNSVAALAVLGVAGLGTQAFADNNRAERAGARAGSAVDRTGESVSNSASRTGQRVEGAADRTGGAIDNSADRAGARAEAKTERAGARTEGAADRTGDKVEKTAASAGEEVSDTWITTKVKTAFVGEDALEGADISVDTESDGLVTLTGTVRNKSAKKRAETIAKNIDGVKQVKNELKVVQTRTVSGRDATLNKKSVDKSNTVETDRK